MSNKKPVQSTNIRRIMRWFEKDGDELFGECELKGIKVSELQERFNQYSSELMYDSYPVREEHVQFLQQYCKDEIDLNLYDYFVECDAE